MSKVAVVYWSSTGNTESMANAVAEGAKAAGAEVTTFETSDFSTDKVDEFDAIAFGCPAMGDEVLEEDEFEPMFSSCEAKLSGKKLGLFGSYGETENGCIIGKTNAKKTVQFLYPTVSFARMSRMTMQ